MNNTKEIIERIKKHLEITKKEWNNFVEPNRSPFDIARIEREGMRDSDPIAVKRTDEVEICIKTSERERIIRLLDFIEKSNMFITETNTYCGYCESKLIIKAQD